jgi:hypothetical protein
LWTGYYYFCLKKRIQNAFRKNDWGLCIRKQGLCSSKQFFSGFFSWFIPGILGAFFITYWIRKIDARKTKDGKNIA